MIFILFHFIFLVLNTQLKLASTMLAYMQLILMFSQVVVSFMVASTRAGRHEENLILQYFLGYRDTLPEVKVFI